MRKLHITYLEWYRLKLYVWEKDTLKENIKILLTNIWWLWNKTSQLLHTDFSESSHFLSSSFLHFSGWGTRQTFRDSTGYSCHFLSEIWSITWTWKNIQYVMIRQQRESLLQLKCCVTDLLQAASKLFCCCSMENGETGEPYSTNNHDTKPSTQ